MSTFILGRRAEPKKYVEFGFYQANHISPKPKLRNITGTPNGYVNYYNRTYILKNINYI